MLFLRHEAYEQPSQALRMVRPSALFSWTPGFGHLMPLDCQSIPTNTINVFGRAWQGTAVTNFGSDLFIPTTGASMVVTLVRVGSPVVSSVGSDDPSTTMNTHLPWVDGTVYWDYGGTSAPNRISISGLTNWDGTWVFTAGPLGSRIFRNGRLLVSSSTPITSTHSGGGRNFGFGGKVGAVDTNAQYSFLYVDGQQFDDSTAQAVSVNPWVLFE